MSWINDAIEGARGKGCPKCLVGRTDLMADPAFACDVCHGTGIPHYQALSATEELLVALKVLQEKQFESSQANDLACAAIAKAEGRAV